MASATVWRYHFNANLISFLYKTTDILKFAIRFAGNDRLEVQATARPHPWVPSVLYDGSIRVTLLPSLDCHCSRRSILAPHLWNLVSAYVRLRQSDSMSLVPHPCHFKASWKTTS